jgi:hypothetical protein
MSKKRKKSRIPRSSDGGTQTETLSESIAKTPPTAGDGPEQLVFALDQPKLDLIDVLEIGEPVGFTRNRRPIQVTARDWTAGLVPTQLDRPVEAALQYKNSAWVSNLFHEGIEVTLEWVAIRS